MPVAPVIILKRPIDALTWSPDLLRASKTFEGISYEPARVIHAHPLPWRIDEQSNVWKAIIIDARGNSVTRLTAPPGFDARAVAGLLIDALDDCISSVIDEAEDEDA